ncbi:cell division ATP-binding protein FtsE [Hydrocarboniphaga sp.]|uniref:cell division ATP-binding protein FtsE n=1 Tax=Hydrocarboniphaga sp. TaxID=2033016 RepID=UPI003D0AFFD0
MSQAIVQFSQVYHRYDGGGGDVLSGVDFQLDAGEMVFLTGASGAGKSTMLRLIALLSRASRGQIVVAGSNLAQLPRSQIAPYRQQIGMIFQNFNLLNDRSVFDNVALPLVIRGHSHQDIGRRVRAALDTVGLLNRERARPETLSGGEQQRVGIARAVVTKPLLLLADEPTGNLDPVMAQEVMRLFERFNDVGVSVLVATHAIDLIERMDRRIVHLEDGRIVSGVKMAAASKLPLGVL